MNCNVGLSAISATLFMLASAMPSTADTLFSSFGAGDTYGEPAYSIPHPIFDFDKLDYDYPAYGFQFSPDKTGTLTNVETVIQSKYDGLVVGATMLYLDDNGSIGTPIAGLGYNVFVVPNVPEIAKAYVVAPFSSLQLGKSEKYWVLFSAYNSQFGGGIDLFARIPTIAADTAFVEDLVSAPLSGTTYNSAIQVAFRIDGDIVVPETTNLTLAIIGLSGLRQRRFKRRNDNR